MTRVVHLGWAVQEVEEVVVEVQEVEEEVRALAARVGLAALPEAMAVWAAARHSPESIAHCPRPEFVARLMLLPVLKLPDCE